MSNRIFWGACVALTIFTGCTPQLSYFTEGLYENYAWTEDELRRVQFYLSDDIVLRREFKGSKSEISSGEIKVVDGKKVEEVVIRKGTPGVFLFSPKQDRLAVSFEADNDRYLMFGPNPKLDDRFALLAKDWRRRAGAVTYDGRLWRVGSESAYASLMVNLKKVRKINVDSRTATGRTVDK